MRKLAALLCGAALVACQSASEPEVGPLPPQLAHEDFPHPDRGSVSSSVVGGGQVFVDGQRRNFSFNALDQRFPQGATVVGQFEMFDPTTSERVHGIITCFMIIGDNEAVVGGQVFLPTEVVEVGFRVVDNRPPGATPDQLSGIVQHGAGQQGNDAQTAFCNGEGDDLDLTDIARGRITVTNHPPAGS